MRRLASILLAALAALALGAGCAVVDCDAYCDRIRDCESDCDRTQCAKFCEQALDNDEVGFAESAQCALEVSCDDLDDGACFPYGNVGRRWCG